MAFRRRTFRRPIRRRMHRRTRGRRMIRRRSRRSRPMGMRSFNFRAIKLDHIKVGGNSSVTGVLTFCLKDFCANFLNWDYYRFNAVVVKFVPQNTAQFDQEGGLSTVCATAVDYDDESKPTSVRQLMMMQNARTFRTGVGHSRKFKPKMTFSVVEKVDSVTTYAPAGLWMGGNRKWWLNTGYSEVKFLGLKYAMQNMSANDIQYQVLIKGYFSFKSPLITAPTVRGEH
ncbi:capsid protein [European catfish circovirus]|uniref:Capsid protein n=1 Tax=European catfish circovirus TaxID=1959744 RepID=I1TEL4_9CIRC|nr:capsid protein [European catfish circovirus]